VWRRQGPSTAAELSVHLGKPQADVEASLNRLMSVGLVVATSTAAHNEAPRWETVGRGIFLDAPDDPDVLATAKALATIMMADLFELPRRWAEEIQPGLSPRWWRASGALNVGTSLTADELDDIQAKIEALLEPFVNRPASERPPDSRQVRLLSFFLPDAD
jgi:hypothetical protein